MKDWFKDWFASDLYLAVYKHRDEADAYQLCNLILNSTKISKGSFILDAACGGGRHANYFSSCGFNVTGFDLSKTLLNVALKQAREQNLNTKFFCSDLRNVVLMKKFDLVTNLFTSFGYFENDKENFAFISSAFALLNNDGFYVLDYLNPSYIEKNLIEESSRKIDGAEIVERRMIRNRRVEKEITIRKNDIEKRFLESVSLYSKEFLVSKICEIGFNLFDCFGDYPGNTYSEDNSQRMILIFRK